MSKNTKKWFCWSAQFCAGGVSYGILEIFWRGFTHISMLLLGGLCFWLLIRISKLNYGLFFKSLLGGTIITAAEFLIGCMVNLWFDLQVWDYSSEPCQFMGQICIRYFLLWCALCAIILPLCKWAYTMPSRKIAFPHKLFSKIAKKAP